MTPGHASTGQRKVTVKVSSVPGRGDVGWGNPGSYPCSPSLRYGLGEITSLPASVYLPARSTLKIVAEIPSSLKHRGWVRRHGPPEVPWAWVFL